MSSPQRLYDPWAPEDPHAPRVEIVVPVRNEEHDLAEGTRRLVTCLRTSFPLTAQVAYMDVDLSTDPDALLPLTRDTGWFFEAQTAPAQAALIHPEGTEQ
jgi:hypothetical protein